MHETGLDNEAKGSISGALSKLLADMYTLYLKTQNFHWNIHGPEFYSLHKLSEEHYKEMAEAIDEVAERIRGMGFFVEGSMESFLKLTSIPEDHKVYPKLKFIEQLIEAHETLIREARSLGNLAEKHADHGTIDMIGRLLLFHEKAVWMLRSTL